MTTRTTAQEFLHGKRFFRCELGHWYVQVFGWHPTGRNPRYSWLAIPEKDVPDEIRKLRRTP